MLNFDIGCFTSVVRCSLHSRRSDLIGRGLRCSAQKAQL